MALNKFMHPRNPYKTPPNFRQLALEFPEFRKYLKQDLSGKLRLNFKDFGAVRELTRTLLLKDYGLNVEIPLDRLVPTLPLRLNYLLWIEDIISTFADSDNVTGIDIGTGASCIYPLLAASHFKWKMLATELDDDSLKYAKDNVTRNNLDHMITVRKGCEESVLESMIDKDKKYDFCMCNPPFFKDDSELDMFSKSRSLERNPPRNCHSGTSVELVAPGGETSFVEKIIKESKVIGPRIKLYTVMIGHKKNVGKIKSFVEKTKPVKIETGEFCQGRTMRWGLAWTYHLEVASKKLPPGPKKQAAKQAKSPYRWMYPHQHDMSLVISRVKEILNKIEIDAKITEEADDSTTLLLTAYGNTWSHSRRKRREDKKRARNMASSPTELVDQFKHINNEIIKESMGEVYNICRKENHSVDSFSLQPIKGQPVLTECKKEVEDVTANCSLSHLKLNENVSLSFDKSCIMVKEEKVSDMDVAIMNSNHSENQFSKEMGVKIKKEIGSSMEEFSSEYLNMNSKQIIKEELDGKCVVKNIKLDTSTNSSENNVYPNILTDSGVTNPLKRSYDGSPNDPKRMKFVFVESVLCMTQLDGDLFFAMNFISGSGGREATNQIFQYIKNKCT